MRVKRVWEYVCVYYHTAAVAIDNCAAITLIGCRGGCAHGRQHGDGFTEHFPIANKDSILTRE